MFHRESLCRFIILIVICSVFDRCKKDDGGPSPTISDFSPTDGSPGDLVVINGTNFNPDPTKDAVSFGGVSAEITNASATQITAKVPFQVRTGEIVVSANGKSTSSGSQFRILGTLIIASVSASSGIAGDIITITGNGFSSDKNRNIVSIGNATAEVTQASPTQLTVVIPPEAVGTSGISVTTSGGTTKFPSFGVHMTVTDFTPTSGPFGTRIKITGTGLSIYFYVTLNKNRSFIPISCTPTELIVAPDGNIGDAGTLTIVENFTLPGESPKSITTTKSFSITDSSPTQLAPFPGTTRNFEPTGFAIGNQLFFGLGTGAGGNLLNDFWKYDSNNDTWTRIADFSGGARTAASGFSYNGKGYIIAGMTKPSSSMVPQKDVWQYDPQQNSWKQLGDFPGAARGYALSFVLGQYAYFGTGSGKDFWRYDPVNDAWLQKGDFPGGNMQDLAGFAVGNIAYVTAGNGQSVFTWEYDPSKDTWTKLLDGSSPYSNGSWGHCVGFTIKGIGYVAKESLLYQLIPDLDSSHFSSWVRVQTAAGVLTPDPSGGLSRINDLGSGHCLASDTNAFIWYGTSGFWKFTPPN